MSAMEAHMKRAYRQGRMGEEIRRIVSELLVKELKDPRLSGLVSVSGVEVTGDGGYATLYIMAPGKAPGEAADEATKKDVLDAFGRAKGLLRREIGSRLRLRHAPELVFKIDVSQEYGEHIEQIFRSLAHEGPDGREAASGGAGGSE
jgi:ribosome-binding factor A